MALPGHQGHWAVRPPSTPLPCLVFPPLSPLHLSRGSTVWESWVWRKRWVLWGRPSRPHPGPPQSAGSAMYRCQGQGRRVVFIINNLKNTPHGSSRPALPSVLLGLLPGRSWQREKGGSLCVADPRKIHLEAPSKALAPPPSPGPLPCKPGPFWSQTHRDTHRQVVTRALGSRGAPRHSATRMDLWLEVLRQMDLMSFQS